MELKKECRAELAPHVIQKYYAQMHKPLVFAKQINA
jgi:hypothetical protein